jgi:hypothetical protein
MRNSLNDLRNHLFEVMEELKDPDGKIGVEKAKAIAVVAAQINTAAKNEIVLIQILQNHGYKLDTPSDLLPPATKQLN